MTSLLGSTFLDPYGFFGSYAARKRRDRLIKEYGGPGTDNVRGLWEYLKDFDILNMDPFTTGNETEDGQRPLVLTVAVPDGMELAVRRQGDASTYGAVPASP